MQDLGLSIHGAGKENTGSGGSMFFTAKELSGFLGCWEGESSLNDHGKSGSDEAGFMESILKLNEARGSCGIIRLGKGWETLLAGGELSSYIPCLLAL